MQPARPSRTALRVALRRAAHQLYDAPLVFTDPLAVPILGPHAAELERTPGRNPQHKPRPHSIGLRAFLVARSQYAEDLLARPTRTGVAQYVILGAGLDTFALRNPYPSLRVFEVDHPATQLWKRDLLRTAALATPSSLTFVPVDFERDSLPRQLHAAGFDSSAPAFFAWLGVVPYLTREAFRSTLAFLESHPAGTGLVLDYTQPRAALPPTEQLARDSLAARVTLSDESFSLHFTPAEIAAQLTAFHDIEDLGTTEINARYFAHRSDNLRAIGSSARILSAWL